MFSIPTKKGFLKEYQHDIIISSVTLFRWQVNTAAAHGLICWLFTYLHNRFLSARKLINAAYLSSQRSSIMERIMRSYKYGYKTDGFE